MDLLIYRDIIRARGESPMRRAYLGGRCNVVARKSACKIFPNKFPCAAVLHFSINHSHDQAEKRKENKEAERVKKNSNCNSPRSSLLQP